MPEDYQSIIKTLQIKFCKLLWSVQDLLPKYIYVIHGNMLLRSTYAVLKPKLYNFGVKYIFKYKAFIFQHFYDQQDAYSCQKASQKTA